VDNGTVVTLVSALVLVVVSVDLRTATGATTEGMSTVVTVGVTDLLTPMRYTDLLPSSDLRQMTLGGFGARRGIPPVRNGGRALAREPSVRRPEFEKAHAGQRSKVWFSSSPTKERHMLAYTYPLLSIFWTMLEFFLFFLWIWLLIIVFSDIFRSHDMGGLAKALWVLFVIIIPYLGVLIYLIARGGSMHERAEAQAAQQQKAFDSYVKQAAGGSSSADELTKLADLKSKGVITDAEFESQKAKLLS
jgi:Short C-terminal domain/Phospholipase_D-nuclease N-terminal